MFISILATTGYLYPILVTTEYFVFILATINDIVISWGDDFVSNAYRVVSRAHCIHSILCEYVHWWIMSLCELVIMCIGETWWIMWTWWFGELYEFFIGELCCLVNLFDDDYFGVGNEVWNICIWIGEFLWWRWFLCLYFWSHEL